MNTMIKTQNAVIAPANTGMGSVSTANETMPLAKAVWAKVFILFLLLGFWRTGGAQSWFQPGNPTVMGDAPVGIGVLFPLMPTADLHVNGNVRFQNLPPSFGLNRYLTTDPAGNLFWQDGVGVQQGFADGQTLSWNSAANTYLPNDFFNVHPTTRTIGIDTVSPLAKLHINESDPVGVNSLRFTRPVGGMAPMSDAFIGQDGSSTGLQIRNVNAHDIRLSTWNQPAMVITGTAGYVGIGENLNPLDRLHIDSDVSGRGIGAIDNYIRWTTPNATTGAQIGYTSASPIFHIRQNQNNSMQFWTAGSTRMTINAAGFVGIGTETPITPNYGFESLPPFGWDNSGAPYHAIPRLSVDGDISTPLANGVYTGNVYIASDERLKQNITNLPDWKRIFEIQPYTYKYINQEHETYSFGFLAQDVNKTLPELTSVWGDALAVNYIGFIPFLSQGLKEHEERLNTIEQRREIPNAEIEELKVENGELKAENQILNGKVETLNDEVGSLNSEVQHMKNRNEQLENKLAALEEKFNAICNLPCIQNNPAPNGNGGGTGSGFGQTGTLGEPPALEQNEPNPFSETTVIRYFLPEGAVNAKIEVRNVENKVVGSFPVSQAGYGNITLSAGTLAAGNYFYSLIINNNIIDTKKMILLN